MAGTPNPHVDLERAAVTRRAFLARAAALTGVAAGMPLLAACGGSDDSSSPTTSAAGSPPTSATASTAASPSTTAPRQSATPQIVDAANAFLATLDQTKKSAVVLAYPSKGTMATAANFSGRVGEQFGTSMWSNFPISDVIRPGLRLGDLSEAQRSAAMAVLAAALSKDGYTKIVRIMDADQALSASGTNYASGKDNYIITFVGTPSVTDRWMLQFGGHHTGLNITIQGNQQAMTPTLTGCQPSSFTDPSGTVRPLGVETDAAFRLVNMLNETQLKQAILPQTVTDLVLGPGKDGQRLDQAGIPGSALTAEQQGVLLQVIGAWVNTLNDSAASAQLSTIQKDLPSTYFAWSGPIAAGSSVYFRVTGPAVIIEYADQGGGAGGGGGPGGGGPGGSATGVQAGGANHIHAVYRSPTNDYGRAFA